jgi:peptide methionine sulfoxide reductase MsrA
MTKEQLIEQIVSMETIYIAGCAWGVQEFLKQLPG